MRLCFGLLGWLGSTPALAMLVSQPLLPALQIDQPGHAHALQLLQQIADQGISPAFGSGLLLNRVGYTLQVEPNSVQSALAKTPKVVAAWQQSDSPWARAAALIASPEPRAARAMEVLADPAPQVRAMAMLLLDPQSAEQRPQLTASLTDARWVAPLPVTVADYAYYRLSAVLTPGQLLEIRREPRQRAALNFYRGVAIFSPLRDPAAALDSDWLNLVRQGPTNTDLSRWQPPQPVLAGLWRQADPTLLEQLLRHASCPIRLVALDALLERAGSDKAMEKALLVAHGGGYLGLPSDVGAQIACGIVAFDAAIDHSNAAQIDPFLAAIDSQFDERTKDYGRSRMLLQFRLVEILALYPALARTQLPRLRRWLIGLEEYTEIPGALRAIAVAGDPADFDLLLQTLRDGSGFSAVRGLPNPLFRTAARRYMEMQHTGWSSVGVSRSDWFAYVLSLPLDQAQPLLDGIFATSSSERVTMELRKLWAGLLRAQIRRSQPRLLAAMHGMPRALGRGMQFVFDRLQSQLQQLAAYRPDQIRRIAELRALTRTVEYDQAAPEAPLKYLWHKYRYPSQRWLAQWLDEAGPAAPNLARQLLTVDQYLDWVGALPRPDSEDYEHNCYGRVEIIRTALTQVQNRADLQRLLTAKLHSSHACELAPYVSKALASELDKQ